MAKQLRDGACSKLYGHRNTSGLQPAVWQPPQWQAVDQGADRRAVHGGRQAGWWIQRYLRLPQLCLPASTGWCPRLYALSCSRRNESRLFVLSASSLKWGVVGRHFSCLEKSHPGPAPGKHERLNLKCATHSTVTACVPISTWGQKRGNSRYF